MKYLYGKATTIALALLIISANYAAADPTCNPKSKGELAALIKKHSPFRGNWKAKRGTKNYSGPINLRSGKYPGILKVQSSGGDKVLNAPGLVKVSYMSSKSLTFNKNGKFRLTLNSDCSLTGTQAHRNGRVDIFLK